MFQFFSSSQPLMNVPLHSVIEVFGAFAGIITGMIMLFRRGARSASHNVFVSCGLFSMGILDIAHASVPPGSLFVWLHSLAVLFGGFLFLFVWVSEKEGSQPNRAVPWVVAGASLAVALFSILFSEQLPAMLSRGEMTSAAIVINLASGLCFLLAAPRFYAGFRSNGNKNDLLFLLVTLLFGLTGFLFYFDSPWHHSWWSWHLFRLAAFITLFGYVVSVFRSIVYAVFNMTGNLTSTTSEIASAVNQHELMAVNQAAMVNETATTMQELGVSSKGTSEQSSSAAEVAQGALVMTGEGSLIVRQTLEGMNSLGIKVGIIANQTLKLGEQTARIGNLANMVKDLSGEINMLALNAAVEAARAGEHGKGFAVVAGEVRKLANESKKSAEQAGAVIAEIQKTTNATILKTEEGTKVVDEVTGYARNVGELFDSLSEASGKVYENAQQVMLNARQQSTAISQAVEVMNLLNIGARETAAGIAQTKIGIDQLNVAAGNLKQIL